jgi:hypothetical protein
MLNQSTIVSSFTMSKFWRYQKDDGRVIDSPQVCPVAEKAARKLESNVG